MKPTTRRTGRRTPRRTTFVILAAALVLGLRLLPARAQEMEDAILEEETMPRSAILGEAGFGYQADTDIDGGGNFNVLRYDVGAVGRLALLEHLHWNNSFFFSVNDYDFDGGGFSTDDPWNTILTMRLGTKLRYQLDERWGIFGGGVFIFSPESGANWGDSFTGGGTVGGSYRHSETLSVSVGIAVLSQIEDDARVVPDVGLNWQPHEQWKVRVGAVPASGGAAAAAEVAYRVLDPLELGLGLLYQQRRFRLSDSGPASEGVGEDNNLPLRARVGWSITPHVSLNLLGGVILGGQLKLDDRDGNRVRKEDYDPAGYVGIRLLAGI